MGTVWNSTIKRFKRLRRKTRIKSINRERRRKRHEKQFGAHADYIRRQLCIVPGCYRSGIQAAHARSRGAGGTAKDLYPCCDLHHGEQHDIGIKSFADKYRVDPVLTAARLWNESRHNPENE